MVRILGYWLPANTIARFAADLALLFSSVVLAATWFDWGHIPFRLVVPSALLFTLVMVALNTAVGLYRHEEGRNKVQTLARAALSWLLSLPVAYSIFVAFPWGAADHEAFALSVLLALGVLLSARVMSSQLGSAHVLRRRVLILGTGAEAADVEYGLKRADCDAQVVGFFDVQADSAACAPPASIIPAGTSLVETVRARQANEIIVAIKQRRGVGLPLKELLDCKLAGVRVSDLSNYFERSHGQVHLESLHASWLIFGEGFRQGRLRICLKRLFDVVAALVLLVGLSPVMLMAAILIGFESGFPLFFGQDRVGQGGRVFRVLKFRSMRKDAEGDGKPRWAAANDERVTRVGRVIRKLRIDELPQLINVLRGDMSMVGPRPERPYFVDQLSGKIPFYAARHSVKPGLTGWAQVRYRYSASLEEAAQKLQYDLYYVKNQSFILDVVILLETVGVVLSGAGAQ